MSTRYEIGKQVKESRKAKLLTQVQLSQITNINKTTISEIENGRFTGSYDIFERILDSLDLQFSVIPKTHTLPDWDEIENIFKEDE